MKYEIIQTVPYPDAKFTLRTSCGEVGTAIKICKNNALWYEIKFYNMPYQMIYNEPVLSISKVIKQTLTFAPPKINPYQLVANGNEQGVIFKRWGHYWLQINGYKYSACAIGFGSEGIKYLVFEGHFDKKDNPTGKQIALIKTSPSGRTLNHYQVVAQEGMAGLIALFFGLYLDADAFYKSDNYNENTYLESYGKWKYLYDPSFEKRTLVDSTDTFIYGGYHD